MLSLGSAPHTLHCGSEGRRKYLFDFEKPFVPSHSPGYESGAALMPIDPSSIKSNMVKDALTSHWHVPMCPRVCPIMAPRGNLYWMMEG